MIIHKGDARAKLYTQKGDTIKSIISDAVPGTTNLIQIETGCAAEQRSGAERCIVNSKQCGHVRNRVVLHARCQNHGTRYEIIDCSDEAQGTTNLIQIDNGCAANSRIVDEWVRPNPPQVDTPNAMSVRYALPPTQDRDLQRARSLRTHHLQRYARVQWPAYEGRAQDTNTNKK